MGADVNEGQSAGDLTTSAAVKDARGDLCVARLNCLNSFSDVSRNGVDLAS